jgi:hypothetical protein
MKEDILMLVLETADCFWAAVGVLRFSMRLIA